MVDTLAGLCQRTRDAEPGVRAFRKGELATLFGHHGSLAATG